MAFERQVREVMVNMINLQKSLGQAKKAVFGAFFALRFVSASMLAITLVGNELSKDMKPAAGSASLQTIEGSTVQTQPEQVALDIYQLPTQKVSTLENIKHMTLPVQIEGTSEFMDAHYAIAGWYRTSDSLKLLTSVGDTISINAKAATLEMANGTTATIGAGPGSARRQLQAGGLGSIVADSGAPTVSEDVDACAAMPCLHDGSCWPIDAEQFTCNCEDTGWTGLLCQTEVDECASQPCVSDRAPKAGESRGFMTPWRPRPTPQAIEILVQTFPQGIAI
jgi:hypothetical protein